MSNPWASTMAVQKGHSKVAYGFVPAPSGRRKAAPKAVERFLVSLLLAMFAGSGLKQRE